MAAIRMPGTLFVIWLVSPWPMNPAPTMPTWIGRPSASRACNVLSTMIIASLPLVRALSGAHPLLQHRLDLVEQGPCRILRRQLGHRQRPRQPEAGVVVAQPALGLGFVELTDLVAGLGRVLEHLVAVRKPLGHVEGAVVVGGELDLDVLEIGGALRPEVDDDVEDRAPSAPDQLGLGGRWV